MIRKLSSSEVALLHKKLNFTLLEPLINAISGAGGRAYLVGGAVRDFLLGFSLKDLDIEVHGLELDMIKKILAKFGHVNEVGKSFGVLKIRLQQGQPEIDFSLPRTDSIGRKPKVDIDPTMTIEKALRRRDLTMNAMAIDLISNQLHDPFGGEKDLRDNTLRCPDAELFVEDPLRFYRVMQFIGRFEMEPDAQLTTLCRTMDVAHVSRERIEEEIKKLMLKADEPSRGFRWVFQLGRMQELFPELAVLAKTVQSPKHHPEGDVFEHTMQVIDAAAQLRSNFEQEQDQLILMYAALCHDLGKAKTTVVRPDGKVTSYNHEVVGVDIAASLLRRFCGNKDIIRTVKKLVRYHMQPGQFITNKAGLSAYKRLAANLAPETNCQMLAFLSQADKRGRGLNHKPLPHAAAEEEFLANVERAGIGKFPEPPILFGRDFLDTMQPGPKLGELVKKAYKLQIEEGIKDPEELKKRTLAR
jgi:tRNA nucleotidyltransferase (CCA-adding enzyme)